MVEENLALQREIIQQKNRTDHGTFKGDPFSSIIGQSKLFIKCKEIAARVAKTDSSIMLIGDTGCGKEVFARAIHEHSGRNKKPFLALNCAAIPESLLEGILFGTTKGVYTGAVEKEGILAQAGGGTIFLDEINSMPLASQAKLLRVLEEKKIMKLGSDKETMVDVRIISSTNESPLDAIAKGRMRDDLFYRLSVVQISIPSLKERRDDIPALVQYFIDRYNGTFHKKVLGVDEDVMRYFMTFAWPGNVRQLKACVESAMNFAKDGDWIRFDDLPQYVLENDATMYPYKRTLPLEEEQVPKTTRADQREDGDEPKLMDAIWNEEKEEIIQALRQAKGNITRAARSLGMSRQSLSYRLKKYNLK